MITNPTVSAHEGQRLLQNTRVRLTLQPYQNGAKQMRAHTRLSERLAGEYSSASPCQKSACGSRLKERAAGGIRSAGCGNCAMSGW